MQTGQVLPVAAHHLDQVRLGYPSSTEQRLKVLEKVLVMMLKVADLAECE